MAISGGCGLIFFFVINFTNVFHGADVLAGCTQIVINAFVFWAWIRKFLSSQGLQRRFAFCGVVVPVIMASITFFHVIIPHLLRFFF